MGDPHRLLVIGACAASVLGAAWFIQTEIAPFHPLWTDQSNYLIAAYQYHAFARRHGLLRQLGAHLAHDAGALGFPPSVNLHMSLVASWVMLAFRPSRLAALTVHLISWGLLLASVAWVVRQITRRWTLAAAGVGLLLTTGFAFTGVGGIADFRMEFPAACWMGIAVSLGCLYVQRPQPRHAWMAATALVVLLLLRLISAAYLATAALALGIIAIGVGWRDRRRLLARSAAPLLLVAGVAVGLAWWDREFLGTYYVATQLGTEIAVRGADQTWQKPLRALLFYPANLVWRHVGLPTVALVVLGAALVGAHAIRDGHRPLRSLPIRRSAIAVCLAFTLGPLVVLTVNPHRSGHLTGIAVAPLVLGALLALLGLVPRRAGPTERALSAGLLIVAVLTWSVRLGWSAPFQGEFRVDALRLREIHAVMYDHLSRVPGEVAWHAVLDWEESLFAHGPWLYGLEHRDATRPMRCILPRQLHAMEPEALLTDLRMASAVIVPRDASVLASRPYPISASMRTHFATLAGWVEASMRRHSVFRYRGVEYDLYLSR